MTLFIVLSVAAGFLVGLAGLVPADGLGTVILGLLLALVFGVGIDLGARGNIGKSVRALGPRVILVPILSLGGGLGAIALVGTSLWGLPWREACALGSSAGWYTLSGPLLTHLASPELGALAFLSDVIRELTALLLIPAVARWIGHAEAVALGGTTSVGTTFAVISHATGGRAAPLAFVHGMIIAITVPFLLPFWLSI